MRMRTPLTLIATTLVALAACGGEAPAPNAPTSDANGKEATKGGEKGGGDTKGTDTTAGSGGGGGGALSCKGKQAVGSPAATFSLDSMNNAGKLAVTPGKVTLIDFWATWCEPCKKSFPKYQELYVKYKASGLEIVAVSVDDDDKKKDIPDFIKAHGAKFPVGWDSGHKIAECFSPPSMPSAFLVDKKGVVRFVHSGFHDGDEKELDKQIKSLL